MVSQVIRDDKPTTTADCNLQGARSDPPDEPELLIRSLSTLLHHIHPQVNRQISREGDEEDQTRDTLNRLASLFLRRGGTDVAAITAQRGPQGNTLAVIHTSDPVLSVVKNFVKRDECMPNSHQSKLVLKELQTNLFSFCLKHGYDTPSLTPVVHAAHLCHLITAVLEAGKGNLSTKRKAILRSQQVKHLRRYLYFYALDKVYTRLNLHVSHGYPPFFDLFFQSSGENHAKPRFQPNDMPDGMFILTLDQIQSSVFKRRPHGWIFKMRKHDERWLLPLIGDSSVKGAMVVQKDGAYHLNLTKSRFWAVLKLFMDSLADLQQSVRHIMNHSPTSEEKDYKNKAKKMGVKSDLENITKAVDYISRLTYTSPSFWRVLFSMESILGLYLLEHREYHVGHEPYSTRDYEPISLVETPAARCSAINPAAARREAEMIGITGGFSFGHGVLVDRIRHWLKCLCQWEKAVEDLATGRAIYQLLESGLHIDVYEVKLPINRTQQATLDATIDAIRPFLKRELSRDQQIMLLAEAAARNKGHPTPSQDCLLGMITSEGVEKGLRAWPSSFVGQSHCETVLALMLFESGATKARMGVTKLCCACCAAFLRALGFKKDARMQHGLVFPWSPPIGAPQHVKERILDFLANHVADHLDRVTGPNADEISRETTEDQTPSGSEPHSTSDNSSNPKDSDDSSDAELEESQDRAEDETITVHTEGDFHSTGNPDEDDEDDSGVEDNEVADEDVREVEELEMEEEEEEPIVGDS